MYGTVGTSYIHLVGIGLGYEAGTNSHTLTLSPHPNHVTSPMRWLEVATTTFS